jgi:hypothetical protein
MSETELIENAQESAPETLYREAPVFDADKESDKDKNRRIAKELFPDDEKDGEGPIKAEKELQAPPAQRRRQAKADIPAIGETPRDKEPVERPRAADGKFAPRAEPVADGAAAEGAEVAAPVVAEEPPVPLEWLAYGETVTIPGALYKPGHGVFIPEAAIPDVRQSWARAQRYPQLVEQNRELRESSAKLYGRKEAQADAVLQIIGSHFKTPQSLQAFAQQVMADPERVQERLLLALERKELEFSKNVVELPSEASEPDAGEIAESLTDEFTRFLADDPELKGKFTPAEQRELRQRVFANSNLFLTKVDRDYDIHGAPVVSAEQQVEVRKGELLVNRGRLLAELRLVAQNGLNGSARTGSARQEGGAPSTPPARRPAPPSAAGRSRANAAVPASQPSRGRQSDSFPNHSLSAASKWLFED